MRLIAPLLFSLLLLLPLTACETMTDALIVKVDEGNGTDPSAVETKEEDVLPQSLEKNRVNPISDEEVRHSAMSRPKVVKIDEMHGGLVHGGKKHFDVVDARMAHNAAVIDASARAVRAITYDNNSVAKDFSLGFDIIWSRVVEAMLTTPLATVDRSSGIITTAWLYDQRTDTSLASNVFGASAARMRYKYTIRVLDLGSTTQVLAVPFLNVLGGSGGWREARPSIVVTDRFFERLEAELLTPLNRP